MRIDRALVLIGPEGPPRLWAGTVPSGSAAPPLDEPEADQAGGEQVEAEQDVEPALVPDREPAEAGEPGQRALDHPAVPAQALGALDTAAGDPRNYAPLAAGSAATGIVVPFIGVQLGRALARPAGGPAARRRAAARTAGCRAS